MKHLRIKQTNEGYLIIKYRDWQVQRSYYKDYYEAFSLIDCDAPMLVGETLSELFYDIDQILDK